MRLLAMCACLACLGLSACGGGGSSTAATRSDPAASGSSPADLARHAAESFLDRYATGDGRVVRSDQGGDTVGEGQAYGMLAAVAIGDQARFERIWSWTRAHLVQPSGLIAFRWAGGRVVDPAPASDADLDAARALLVGACRFNRPALRDAAIRIGHAILGEETGRAAGRSVLVAGPWARRGGELVFNPSYVDPTTLDALGRVTGDPRFRAVAAGSLQLLDELARPLPPDWATVATASGQATPVSGASSTTGPGSFRFDAPRTLIRLGESSNPQARGVAARAWGVFSATRPQDVVTEHALTGAPTGRSHHPVTLVSVAAAARAAGDAGAVPVLLTAAEQQNAASPSYYGSAWLALGRILLSTDQLTPCNS